MTVVVCVTDAPVPIMVSVYVPGTVAIVVATVIVELPDVVTEAGLKDAVTPAGKPLAENVTAPVNPFDGVIVTVYSLFDPLRTVWLAGEATRVKLCAGIVTTKVTVAECVAEVPVPVMVRVYVPGTVAAVVATVIVELPDVVSEAGLNDAVTPAGKPLADKVTAPVKPFEGVTVTV